MAVDRSVNWMVTQALVQNFAVPNSVTKASRLIGKPPGRP